MSPPPFHPFGRVHLVTVLVIVAIIALAAWWGRARSVEEARRGGRVLAVVLVVYYLVESVIRVQLLGAPPVRLLPLEICSILFFVGAIAHWTDHPLAAEILFFWTFAGTLHSLITPTPGAGYPHLEFFRYFACHGLLILSAVYSVIAVGRRVTLRSAIRAFLALQAYEILVGIVDVATGQNFLYLRQKPPSPTLFDSLGPWPYYLLSLEVVAAISFYIWLRAASFVVNCPLGRGVSVPRSGS